MPKINALELLDDALLLELVGQGDDAIDLVKKLSQIPQVRRALKRTDVSNSKSAVEIDSMHKDRKETIRLSLSPNENWLL